jgi:hypothetical protein
MFNRILNTALREAGISEEAFDAAIRQARFKSRLDWFVRGAPASLQEAYNLRAAWDVREACRPDEARAS